MLSVAVISHQSRLKQSQRTYRESSDTTTNDQNPLLVRSIERDTRVLSTMKNEVVPELTQEKVGRAGKKHGDAR